MPVITPPSMTAAPTSPDRADRATFTARSITLDNWRKNQNVPEMTAALANVFANATDTAASAVSAASQVALAVAQVVLAATQATNAANSAAAAAVSVATVATVWVSGTTYAIGDLCYSPITFITYRRKTAGAGTTDPSLDTTNWGPSVFVTVNGNGGATATGNVTLTASSAGALFATPANPGLYVTLPDATTLTKSVNNFSIYNAGEYDLGIKDSTGVQLGWVWPRTQALIGLADNATAAGLWSTSAEKTGVTARYANTTATATGSGAVRRIALDANRLCFLFGGANCYGVVYDASSQIWGTAVLLKTSRSSGAFVGILSAANQVLMVSCDSSTGFEANTLSISGTTITLNATVSAVLANTFGGSLGLLTPVGTSWAIGYNRSATTAAVRAITVSGTVPTIGAETALSTTNSTLYPTFATGSVLRTFAADATPNLTATPYTVSGTTLTVGTASSAIAFPLGNTRFFQNGNGNIVAQYVNSTHFAAIFKLTSTTEAVSTISLGTNPNNNILNNTDFFQLTASKTVFVSIAGVGRWYANILTDTAGTASAGTEITDITYTTLTFLAALNASGNLVRFGLSGSGGGTYTSLQLTLDCSGTSPTLSNTIAHNGNASTNGGASVALFRASDAYGARNFRVLVSGNIGMALSLGNQVFDLTTSPNAICRTPALTLVGDTNGSGTVGGASNDSYVTNSLTSGAGFVLQRVELAA